VATTIDLNIGGIFSPDAVLAASESVGAALRTLAKEIFDAQPDVPDDFFADWSAFTRDYTAWKAGNSSWFSRVWNTTRDELVVFVGRYKDLRSRWLDVPSSSGATNAPDFAIRSDSVQGALESAGAGVGTALKSIGLGAAVLAGVIVGGYLLLKAVR
jgi:hypothetical protein